MFSSRLDWRSEPNALTRAIEERRRRGAPIIDLSESNPTRCGFEYEGVMEALGSPASLVYEPDPRGMLLAREAVAAYYAGRGEVVGTERIWLTASTSEAYALLIKLLADPGDEILVPRPSYPLLDILGNLEGVRIGSYPLAWDERAGWHVDVDVVEETLSDRTRAILLVNPNNPTGSYLRSADRAALIDACASRRIAIIADEVFFDYRHDPHSDACSPVGAGEALCFVLSGVSKILALPQMKIGWIVMSGPGDLVGEASTYLDLIADSYLSVATPAQRALTRWLPMRSEMQKQITARLRRNLAALLDAARAAPWRVLPVEGGWYAVIELGGCDGEDEIVSSLVERDGVIVHPGYFFDFQRGGYLVVSLLPRPDQFDAGLTALRARFDR